MFWLTLCGLTSQKTHQGGLGLGGSVHEEAHPCVPYLIQTSFKGIDTGSIHHPLVQLIPSINHFVWKKYLQQSRVHRNLISFLECPLVPLVLSAKVNSEKHSFPIPMKTGIPWRLTDRFCAASSACICTLITDKCGAITTGMSLKEGNAAWCRQYSPDFSKSSMLMYIEVTSNFPSFADIVKICAKMLKQKYY